MGKRLADGTWQDSCLEKVQPEEPIFVLRGQDMLAPKLVEEWALEARKHGLKMDKFIEAMTTADAMRAWHYRKYPD